jgi:hypothetical protein
MFLMFLSLQNYLLINPYTYSLLYEKYINKIKDIYYTTTYGIFLKLYSN